MLGLRKPVNVLQQGASVDAIVHMTAITVARAIRQKSIKKNHKKHNIIKHYLFILKSYQHTIRLSYYLILNFHTTNFTAYYVHTYKSATATNA